LTKKDIRGGASDCMGHLLCPFFSMSQNSAYLHGSIPNETEVAGKRSDQFGVTPVEQQSFHVTLRVTSNLNQRHSLMKP
jgi:hypothetical protein